MKVKELIEKLQKFDEDIDVAIAMNNATARRINAIFVTDSKEYPTGKAQISDPFVILVDEQ